MKKTVGVIGVVAFLFLLFSSPVQARIRDQFYGLDGFGDLNPAFERMANQDKFNNTEFDPKFEELSNVKPQIDKLGSLDNPMNKVTLKPSFERLSAGNINLRDSVSSGLGRLATVSSGISGELRPSFTRLATLSPAMQGELTPAFTRIASLREGLTGELRPSFVRLGQVSPALVGELRPSFVRLGDLRLESMVHLRPSFVRMAALSPAFSGALRPAFDRWQTLNPQFAARMSPGPERLTFDRHKISSLKALRQATQPFNLHTVPGNIQLRSPRPALWRNIVLDQFFGGTGSLYRLSLTPEELRGLSSRDVTELLQQEIYLIRPEFITSTSPAVADSSITPQHISLISLLGVDKAK